MAQKTADATKLLIEKALRDLLERGLPADRLINQAPARAIPPASGTTRGSVTLSDDDPLASDPVADPGTSSSASRGDHVHPAGSVGTVTSVGLTAPPELSVSGSPVTSSGTLGLTWATEAAHLVFAGPASGAAATPAFRALVALDLPAIAYGSLTGIPATFAPSAHATSHQSGGADALALGSIAGTIDDTQHGARAGGTLHPAATTSAAGFMTGADKTKLDGIASGAAGTVTSVALTAPAELGVTGSPITGAGTLALAWAAKAANLVLAGPASGASATPAFRALDPLDIPALAASKITTGQLPLARGGTNADLSATGGANQVVRQNSAGGALSVSALAAADIPALDSAKTTTGEIPRSPLTTRGDLLTQNPSGTHTRLALGASGRFLRSNGTDPVWQVIDLSADVTSTLGASNGGTGLASYAVGDVLYASGAAALSKLAGVATGNALISGGVTTAPSWGKIGLATHVSGVLPTANGGTGVAALPSFLVHKNGTNQTGVVTATFTKLTWSTEVFDTASAFASDKFTPQVAGTYLFVIVIYWDTMADQSYMIPTLYKNGSRLAAGAGGAYRSSGALDQSCAASGLVQLNGSTDYIEAYAFQQSGVNQTINGSALATYFAAAWIAP